MCGPSFVRLVPSLQKRVIGGIAADERYAVAYWGRVSNDRELRAALSCDAYLSTAAVLLRGFSRYREDLSARVRGEVSLVAIDLACRQLYAACDHLGTQPLYWIAGGGMITCASNCELLLASLSVRPTVDRDGMLDFLARGGIGRPPRTILSGVARLRGGHGLRFDHSGVNQARYWFPRITQRLKSPEDYADALRSLLSDAAVSTIAGQDTVCVDLSGGLDSSTVASTAVHFNSSNTEHARRIVGCSLVASQTRSADESDFQTDVASFLGIERHTFDIDEDTSFDPRHRQPWYRPAPEFSWPYAVQLLRDHADKTGIRLSGLGGDPAFAGRLPPLNLHHLLRSGRVRDFAHEFAGWLRSGRYSAFSLIAHWCAGTLNQSAGAAPPSFPVWLTRDAVAQLTGIEPNDSYGHRVFDDPSIELQFRMIQVDADIAASSRSDRIEAYPLLYSPLVEFLLGVPWSQKATSRGDRILQRRTLEGYLPESVLRRRTKAHGAETTHKGLRKHWDSLRHLAFVPNLAGSGIVEPSRFGPALQRLLHGLSGDHWRFFVGVLAVERWLEAYTADAHQRAHQQLMHGCPSGFQQ